MKVHIAIGEYEFVEFEAESPDEAVLKSLEIKETFNQEGLEAGEWNEFVEEVLSGTLSGDPEIIERLSKAQRYWYDVTRRGKARINYKEN